MSNRSLPLITATACAFCCFAFSSARAVILLGTGDPEVNITAPTGDLAGSGWQFQGTFGDFLGTPISSDAFITAQHVSGASPVFVYHGISYNLVAGRNDAYGDLTIWKVDGIFPFFAPLYTSSEEIGQRLVVIGRGTPRGDPVMKNGTPRGWLWGLADMVQRWGENVVTDIVNGGPVNQYVYSQFDVLGPPNEAHLSSGDSGGAVFLQDGVLWKLAGISYSVDGFFYETETGGGAFDAALYDARDYYYQDSQASTGFSLITGAAPVPSGFYATRISSKLTWIYSVIDPGGDIDGNGIPNLVQYAQSLNQPAPLGPGAPEAVRESGFFSIVYRKFVLANGPRYEVQQSGDLQTWTPVSPTETLLFDNGEVYTIQARVPATGDRLFLRVVISPPLPEERAATSGRAVYKRRSAP